MKVMSTSTDFPPEKPRRTRGRPRKLPSEQARAVAPVALEHQAPESDLEQEFTASDALRRVEDMADDRKVKGWTQDDLDILSFILFAAVFIGTAKLAQSFADPSYKPTSDELDRFCKPLARIVARRIKIPAGRSGDVIDGLACFAAVASYGMRVWDHEDRKRHNPYVLEGGPAPMTPAPVTAMEPPANGTQPRRAAMPAWARENLEQDQ